MNVLSIAQQVAEELGIPVASALQYIGQQVPRQAGLTARALASGTAGMGSVFANPLAYTANKALEATGSDYRFPDQYEAVQDLLSGIGLPKPEGALEKGVNFAAEIGVPDPTDSARFLAGVQHMIDPDMVNWAMTVFHGSPHKWDRVDLSKVGTGEGAQAYGHGFYVAENPKVAKDYQRTLGQRQKLADEYADIAEARAQGRSDKQAIGYLEAKALEIDDLAKRGDADELDIKRAARYRNAQEMIRAGDIQRKGHLYELDLPDSTIDKMLDWDKPLSEQPESVLKALDGNLPPTLSDAFSRDYKGSQILVGLQNSEGVEGASKYLNSLGIPGIKYLDGTSRPKNVTDKKILSALERNNGDTDAAVSELMATFRGSAKEKADYEKLVRDQLGSGYTRNFVVFDESYITPLKRNNEPIK